MAQVHHMKEPNHYVQDVQQPNTNQYSGLEKNRQQANDFLNKSISPALQKHNFGVQPAAVHTHNSSWATNLFSCFAPPDLCLMGCCCPCFLFGRTQARNNGERNPDLFSVNLDCAAWCGLYAVGGFQWIYTTLKRMEMRDRLGIHGSPITDCLTSCCCHCCSLIQEEKESLLKQDALNQKDLQYSAPTGMSYQ